ncbi:MAG: hypothetical protein AAF471_08920, partial [Myxococcota bacterium]
MTETRFAATVLLTLLGGIALAVVLSVALFLPLDRDNGAGNDPGRDKTRIHEGTAPASSRSEE